MGILNVTPDSFSDGGRHNDVERALAHTRRMIDEGADVIDVGGESTRPGSQRVDAVEQIARVVPVIRAIRADGIEIPISIDTTRAEVAAAALDAGADAVNDVAAGLEDEEMLPLVAARDAGVVLMHRLVPPHRDSYSNEYASAPDYDASGGVVEAVFSFLAERVEAACRVGVTRDRIVIDPGAGFGKSVAQNFELLAAAPRFFHLGVPLLCGVSRKSFLGSATGVTDPAARVEASVRAALEQRDLGVRLFRVHDVAAHRQALG